MAFFGPDNKNTKNDLAIFFALTTKKLFPNNFKGVPFLLMIDPFFTKMSQLYLLRLGKKTSIANDRFT